MRVSTRGGVVNLNSRFWRVQSEKNCVNEEHYLEDYKDKLTGLGYLSRRVLDCHGLHALTEAQEANWMLGKSALYV